MSCHALCLCSYHLLSLLWPSCGPENAVSPVEALFILHYRINTSSLSVSFTFTHMNIILITCVIVFTFSYLLSQMVSLRRGNMPSLFLCLVQERLSIMFIELTSLSDLQKLYHQLYPEFVHNINSKKGSFKNCILNFLWSLHDNL